MYHGRSLVHLSLFLSRPTLPTRISLSANSLARALRVSLSALGGTFLRFSSASRARSTRFVLPFVSRALCFFLFPPTPDAANCALLDEILLPPAVAAASPPPSPPPLRCAAARLPLPIHLPRKRRDRTTRPLYLPEREIDKKRERERDTNSLYSPAPFIIMAQLMITLRSLISYQTKQRVKVSSQRGNYVREIRRNESPKSSPSSTSYQRAGSVIKTNRCN